MSSISKELLKYIPKNTYIVKSKINPMKLIIKLYTIDTTYNILFWNPYFDDIGKPQNNIELIPKLIKNHNNKYDDEYHFQFTQYRNRVGFCNINSIPTTKLFIDVNNHEYLFKLIRSDIVNENITNKNIINKHITDEDIPNVTDEDVPNVTDEEANKILGHTQLTKPNNINIESELQIENKKYKLIFKVQLKKSNLYHLYFYLKNIILFLIKNKPDFYSAPKSNKFLILEQSINLINN